MRFRREIHDMIDPPHEPLDRGRMSDISANELVAAIVNAAQVFEMTGIGEFVEIDQARDIISPEHLFDELGTDEPGAARNQQLHECASWNHSQLRRKPSAKSTEGK